MLSFAIFHIFHFFIFEDIYSSYINNRKRQEDTAQQLSELLLTVGEPNKHGTIISSKIDIFELIVEILLRIFKAE